MHVWLAQTLFKMSTLKRVKHYVNIIDYGKEMGRISFREKLKEQHVSMYSTLLTLGASLKGDIIG